MPSTNGIAKSKGLGARVRTGMFNFDRQANTNASAVRFEKPERTKQAFKDECDINVIVRRFGVTGTVPILQELPTFKHFEGIFDFQSAQNAIVRARESFMKVPADIRARFANDPQKFVAFCTDEKNLEELRKMGLAKPEVKPPPERIVSVRVVPEEKPPEKK